MFEFGYIQYLHLLWIIPVLVLLFWIMRRKGRKQLERFASSKMIARMAPMRSRSKPWWKYILLMLALAAIILAIARPRFGTRMKEVQREGKELVVALDVSRSMLATDIQPSRLERAKRAIVKLLDRLDHDRISLIVFAGEAYTQLPLTTDYPAAKMFISSVQTEMIPQQGTAIGAAIGHGINSFSPGEEKNKALIIITDGENHEGNAIENAQMAAEKGIKVYTIGMGLPEGGPIPVRGKNNEFHRDNSGNVVITKLNEGMLQQIAAAGEGSYIRANNIRSGLNSLFDEIDQLEKAQMKSKVYAEYDEQFQFAAWIALFFLVLEFFILERKNKYLANVKIFQK
ncbi:cobaltochelatase subunit [Salinivirga cyanobacteriivorans]|uniref:Cobaltochelatase subunit n=1 Tax=Salinivirga cyanobacteriivorans TaxID=1307839 RepID=A0A0S2I367_9BACT|nr:VWA domain-containing protein [Salinivirga cyanobacteriivorans]ALO16492.1 cobaltochelatase subunit [Salinivirga cyanobacteriivorans]